MRDSLTSRPWSCVLATRVTRRRAAVVRGNPTTVGSARDATTAVAARPEIRATPRRRILFVGGAEPDDHGAPHRQRARRARAHLHDVLRPGSCGSGRRPVSSASRSSAGGPRRRARPSCAAGGERRPARGAGRVESRGDDVPPRRTPQPARRADGPRAGMATPSTGDTGWREDGAPPLDREHLDDGSLPRLRGVLRGLRGLPRPLRAKGVDPGGSRSPASRTSTTALLLRAIPHRGYVLGATPPAGDLEARGPRRLHPALPGGGRRARSPLQAAPEREPRGARREIERLAPRALCSTRATPTT